MGQLDYLLGGAARRAAAPRFARPTSGFRLSLPKMGDSGPPEMGPPERFSLNKTFDDLSNSGAGIFATAGQLPSRVMENPVSIADTASRLFTGGRITGGKATGGFSPVEAIGQTPVGAVGGFLGEAFKRSGNFVPSLINSTDANVWKAVGTLPDDTEITDDLVRKQLERMGESSLFAEGEKTGGIPILGPLLFGGIGDRWKTVGEFKEELAKRGFFYDENTGQPIDPADMAKRLRSGQQSTFNFGYAATNDNALVDTVTRLALDPSNALFFVPGGALFKAGSIGARLLPASRLIRAGVLAERAPRAVVAAEAIMRGAGGASRVSAARPIGTTLAGVARALSGYRTAAVASTIATYGVNTAANAINTLADDELPFITEIRDFTGAVQNAQPMSGNAAFMLLGAATFPYGRYAGKAVAGAKSVRNRLSGVEDLGAFHREYGGRAKFEEQFGGPEGVNDLAGFLDVQLVRDLNLISPAEQATLANLGSMSLRRRFEQLALGRIVNRARRDGLITADMRLEKFKEFHSKQAGFAERGMANPWDATRAARRWNAWQPVRKAIQPVLDDTGEVIWGLRDDVIFHEQLDAGRTNLKAAIYKDAKGVKRIRQADILDFLEDNPNVNSLDNTGKWAQWTTGKVDPTWDSVSRKLANQKRSAVKIDDYTAELTAWEKGAPKDIETPERKTRQQRIRDLRDELKQTYADDGSILPDRVADSQRLQGLLEDELAQENGVQWARTEQADKRSGADPVVGRRLNEAIESDDMVAPPRLSPGLERLDDATVNRVKALESEVLKIDPSYRLKRAPEKDILALVPKDGAIDVALRHRRALSEWLFDTGPLSPLDKMWSAMTRPIGRGELQRDAKAAFSNELIPLGVKPEQVTYIIEALNQTVKDSVKLKRGTFEMQMYRDIGSISPTQVARVAERVLNRGYRKGKINPAIAKIEAAGGFYRLLAKSSSRYARSLTAKAAKGDKGAKALRTIYDIWNDAPVLKDVAVIQREVAKFYYPLIRFMADPRWIALNMSEAQFLSLGKDGFVRAYKSMEQASPAAQRFTTRDMGMEAPDVGLFFGRSLDTHIAKSFDVRSGASVIKVIDEMGENSPVLSEVRRNMAMEGEAMMQKAQRDHAAGDITQRQFDAEMGRAQRLQDGGKRAMSEHLNDTLYGYETKGVDATIVDGARKVLRDDEIQVLRDSGMLDRLVEVNRKAWNDAREMYHGNAERSTIERLMNSYWFFWPISYQIKATKWLTDIMLNGSFGHNNNALLAGKYALFMQEHKERMTNNLAYAAMYAAHPSLWFTAQMLLPMAPEDIGVSMSRASRLAGTVGQNFLNSWLGTEIGVFTADKQAEDPASAIGWLTKMGPSYTFELAQRLINEADDAPSAPRSRAPQITPTPSTGLPSLSVR